MSRKTRSSKTVGGSLSAWVLLGGLVLALLLVGGAVLWNTRTGTTPSSRPVIVSAPTSASLADRPVTELTRANAAQGSWYTVYFTQPTYPERATERHGGLDQAIISDLERATSTIDVAVFDLRLPSLVDALVRARQRGVQVRAVVDYAANEDAPDFTDAIEKLEAAGIAVTKDHRSSLMHNKFALIDNRLLWTGSMNFTPNDTYRNNNNMLRLSSPELIQNYSQIFERLYLVRSAQAPSKNIPHPQIRTTEGVTVANYFSPNGGAKQAILDRIKGAQKNIRITAFAFTDTDMASALKSKHKAGVQIQGVFESRNNSMLGAEFTPLTRAGLDILEDGNCYILHSKLMIIDDRTIITGSYNFTQAASRSNDENVLIIDDPHLAQAYIAEFERIWKQAKSPQQCS